MSHHTPGSRWAARVIAVLLALITILLFLTLGDRLAPHEKPVVDGEPVASEPSGVRPNVVIFLIDTLRADRLGVYGHDKATSPHIDALAREGITYKNAYAPAPWTLPTVVSLFTSTFPCEHGVLVDGQRAAKSFVTLAQRLQSAGYATASFHANPYAGAMSGMDAGFDQASLVQAVDGAMVDQWLEQTQEERPFFLYIHNVEPHDPYIAPRRLIEQFGSVTPEQCLEIGRRFLTYRALTRVDFAQGRPLGTTDNTDEQIQAMKRIDEFKREIDILYDAAVRHADERVGEVVNVLKARGLWEDTLFFLVADHGEELGDHGGWQHDQSVYEELVHVPLIMRKPHSVQGGRTVAAVVSLVDIMPTMLDLTGVGGGCVECSGSSLPSTATAPAGAAESEITIPAMRWNIKKYFRPYKEQRGDINVVVRRGAWKGVFNAEPRTLELYDLTADPLEQRNVAGQHESLVAAFRLEARQWFDACTRRARAVDDPDAGTLDQAQLERLRSLGYIE